MLSNFKILNNSNLFSINLFFAFQVPHKAVIEKVARKQEREALEIQKKNASYKLLSDDDSDEHDYVVPTKVGSNFVYSLNFP